jgi:hypothetical protein
MVTPGREETAKAAIAEVERSVAKAGRRTPPRTVVEVDPEKLVDTL